MHLALVVLNLILKLAAPPIEVREMVTPPVTRAELT
jgi:hypothetical protein